MVDVPDTNGSSELWSPARGGIDFFLVVVAADDGMMPQTEEHSVVLASLGVDQGVIAITKADRADPDRAPAEVGKLLPGSKSSSAWLGPAPAWGTWPMRSAGLPAASPGGRRGKGRQSSTSTGPSRSRGRHGRHGDALVGEYHPGDRLVLLPARREVRVRSVEVHDDAVETADAGQRVAVNLSGIGVRELSRGDAVVARKSEIEPTTILDCALSLGGAASDGERVQVHHGTRNAAGRVIGLGDGLWQVRLEQPILAARGDRIVVRSVAPPDTLGGGVVLDPAARRHGRTAPAVARLERLRRGEDEPNSPELATEDPREADEPERCSEAAMRLADRLREAGHLPEPVSALGSAATELAALRSAGIAVRVGPDMYAHRAAVEEVGRLVAAVIGAEGSITLGRLRDELATSRKYAQAWLEHLDAGRLTKRLPDNRRVLRRHFDRA